jgi:hypothetical protein
MKLLSDPVNHLGVFNEFAKFWSKQRAHLGPGHTRTESFELLSEVIEQAYKDPKIVHGHRAQAMFLFVAQALGGCTLIMEEDTGHFAGTASASLRRPDFRVHTEHDKFFIEVKNHYQTEAFQPFEQTPRYLEQLQAYAKTHDLPLKFAVYWAKWNLWTLVSAERFTRTKVNKLSLTLQDAVVYNEMVNIGDRSIALPPPSLIRLHADPTRAELVEPDRTSFLVQKISVIVGGQEILDRDEQRLAIYLILFGHWSEAQNVVQVENTRIRSCDFIVSSKRQEHSEATPLSSMAAARYRQLTETADGVHEIYPGCDPIKACPNLLNSPKWKQLKLMYMTILPKSSESSAAMSTR